MAKANEGSRLHRLCKEGKYKKVEEFITTCSDLETRLAYRCGVFGYTPLHESVSNGRPKILQLLIDHGADVNCCANGGYTPLHLAAFTGHKDCVHVLLGNNADISKTDDYGKTPMQTAELSARSDILKVLKSAGEFACVSFH